MPFRLDMGLENVNPTSDIITVKFIID